MVPGELTDASTLHAARALLELLHRSPHTRDQATLDRGERAALDLLAARGLVEIGGDGRVVLTDLGARAAVSASTFEEHTGDVPRGGSAPSDGGPSEARTPVPALRDAGPQLMVVTADGASRAHPLGGACSMGRSADNDIVVDDKRASKHHARIYPDAGGWVIQDLDSANGTLLNGAYCVEPTRLSDDDEIVIGRTLLVFQGPTAGADRGPAPRSAPPPEDRPAPVGPPTERPAEVEVSGIRVVRGRPASEGGSGDVFEPDDLPPEPSLDFEATTGDTDGGAMSTDDPFAEESTDGAMRVPDVEPEAPLPPFAATSELPPFEPASAEPPVVELSEVVAEAVGLPEAAAEPSEEEATVSVNLPVDPFLAEELPEASASLVDFELPAEVGPPPSLLESLERLEARVHERASDPDRRRLLDAITVLRNHGLVRAFADEEDDVG